MFAANRLRNQSCHIRARRARRSSGPSIALDVAAGDVEEPRGPERGVHRVREQLVDLLRPLVRRPIGEEGADLSRRRQRADHVERDPAEELGVGRRSRGRDAQAPELGVDLAVDQIALRDVGDGHDPSGGHRHPAEASRPLYEATTAVSPGRRPRTSPPVATVGDGVVADAEVAERGDVGFRAVGEPGDDREPARAARPLEVRRSRGGSRSARPPPATGRAGPRRRSRRG